MDGPLSSDCCMNQGVHLRAAPWGCLSFFLSLSLSLTLTEVSPSGNGKSCPDPVGPTASFRLYSMHLIEFINRTQLATDGPTST